MSARLILNFFLVFIAKFKRPVTPSPFATSYKCENLPPIIIFNFVVFPVDELLKSVMCYDVSLLRVQAGVIDITRIEMLNGILFVYTH